jgi:hypothetical protein
MASRQAQATDQALKAAFAVVVTVVMRVLIRVPNVSVAMIVVVMFVPVSAGFVWT